MIVVGLALVVLGLIALVTVIAVAKRRPDTKEAELREEPAFGVTFPAGTLLDRTDIGSAGGAGALHTMAYGTEASLDDVEAYFDQVLPPLGYEVVRGPEPGERGATVVREYRRGPARFTVELTPLPRKVGTRWIRTGYPHILYTTIRN
jgi:hypothetical protein